MIDSYTININKVGIVTLERSLRAKRVVISVKPFKGVRVAVPVRVSFRKAEAFVFSKTDWIKKHLEKMKQFEMQKEPIQDNLDDIEIAKVKKMLTSRLYQLAEKHGLRYNKVSIRRQRTRWGSCSHNNNISLNVKLVRLSDELIDYVILHELVHTRIHNHSKRFWAELDKYVGNARTMAKKLRSGGLELV
jgi:predicted metal-dependent hydrolase